MLPNSVETFDPSEAAAVATTMTMPAAITPYSIAVTPLGQLPLHLQLYVATESLQFIRHEIA
jgi:hypothetical protein